MEMVIIWKNEMISLNFGIDILFLAIVDARVLQIYL